MRGEPFAPHLQPHTQGHQRIAEDQALVQAQVGGFTAATDHRLEPGLLFCGQSVTVFVVGQCRLGLEQTDQGQELPRIGFGVAGDLGQGVLDRVPQHLSPGS